MQKKIIALAVAGLVSGAAFAQTNVTIWGVADAGFVNMSGDQDTATTVAGRAADKGGRFTGIQSGLLSGSRLGFKGEEALGNGLKAFFHLEYMLTLDENVGVGNGGTQSGSNARQQFIGLNGGFGTVAWGRMEAPGTSWHNKYDAQAGAAFGAQNLMHAGDGNTFGTGTRLNSTMAYISPNFSGFQATVAYSFNPVGNTEQNGVIRTAANTNAAQTEERDGAFALRLEYDNGPLSVGFAWHRLRDLGQSDAASAHDRENHWGLGASYNLGMAKLFGSYERDRIDYHITGNTNYRSRIWQLGVDVPVGNGNIRVNYSDHEGSDRNRATGAALAAGLSNEANAWTFAYLHNLSKRTTAYAAYTHAKSEDGFRGTVASGNIMGTSMQWSQNDSINLITAGMRHTF